MRVDLAVVGGKSARCEVLELAGETEEGGHGAELCSRLVCNTSDGASDL